jgi:hypothetical protein
MRRLHVADLLDEISRHRKLTRLESDVLYAAIQAGWEPPAAAANDRAEARAA